MIKILLAYINKILKNHQDYYKVTNFNITKYIIKLANVVVNPEFAEGRNKFCYKEIDFYIINIY